MSPLNYCNADSVKAYDSEDWASTVEESFSVSENIPQRKKPHFICGVCRTQVEGYVESSVIAKPISDYEVKEIPGKICRNCIDGNRINQLDRNGFTPMTRAVYEDQPDIVRTLIIHNADVNLADSLYWTPLITAADGNCINVLPILLDSGADINLTDRNGWFPLRTAVFCGHVEAVELLLKGGADVNKSNYSGKTAIHDAFDNKAILELLIKKGGDIDKSDNSGMTVLRISARTNNMVIVEFLIKSGADVDKSDRDGVTVLHASVRNKVIVEILIKSGADIDKSNKYGMTALHLASDIEVIEFLIRAGANIEKSDNFGNTPEYVIDNAYGEGVTEILKSDLGFPAYLSLKNQCRRVIQCNFIFPDEMGKLPISKQLIEYCQGQSETVSLKLMACYFDHPDAIYNPQDFVHIWFDSSTINTVLVELQSLQNDDWSN